MGEDKYCGRTVIISLHVPVALVETLDKLVEAGVFNNRSEAIRVAIYRMLMERGLGRIIQASPMEVGYR